jgi:NarL family two-component system response regulator LiaR
MDKIKILIVDDHPMMRDALKMAFTEEEDLQVIGEASDAVKAIKLLESLTPDVILMDLLMPKMSGVEAIARITANNPEAKILVLSSMEDEDHILTAIQAGALGYFPKSDPRPNLLEAVRKIARGFPYMPSDITLKLFQRLRGTKMMPQEDSKEALTSRQNEILLLMSEGKSDEEIGNTLHLQESTVRAHIHHILQRLNLENRSQAVAYVHQHLKNE